MNTMDNKEEKHFSYLVLVIFLFLFLNYINLIFLSEHLSMKIICFLGVIICLLGMPMIYIRDIKGITLKSKNKKLEKTILLKLYCLYSLVALIFIIKVILDILATLNILQFNYSNFIGEIINAF